MTITEAIAEAAEFIYATLDHAAECELENQDDANFHCEIEHESGYRSQLKEIADVLRQAAPTNRHQPGCDGSGSHRRGCTYGFYGPSEVE